jgi:hypothetical protein
MTDTPERALLLLRRLVELYDNELFLEDTIAEVRDLLSAPPASECRWTPGMDDDIWSTACGRLYQVDTRALASAAISEVVRCPCGGIILTPAPPASEGEGYTVQLPPHNECIGVWFADGEFKPGDRVRVTRVEGE